MSTAKLTVTEWEMANVPFRTRFPFSYGIATLTETLHCVLRLEVRVNDQVATGFAADNLAPKWFIKDADLSLAEEQQELLKAIHHALQCVVSENGNAPTRTLFQHWLTLAEHQAHWAVAEKKAPLLASFGLSMVERALWDALGKATRLTAHQLLQAEELTGVNLGQLRPELAQITSRAILPRQPSGQVDIRHCVGLADPLTAEDLTSPRPADTLPYTLAENIQHYGLTHFKIKLSGDWNKDTQRLSRIFPLLPAAAQWSLDANENFPNLPEFRHQWELHLNQPYGQQLQKHLLWVEQPLHRDTSLTPETALGLKGWHTAPPIIIDEADASLSSVPKALEIGYAGTSHKNCKGILKSVVNKGTIAAGSTSTRKLILSAEDLTNLPPIALQQDLAVLAALGLTHAERNGHHYVNGLNWAPKTVAQATAAAHPDILEENNGQIRLRIVDGALTLNETNLASGLGQATPSSELLRLMNAASEKGD